ncbi:MAG: sporulation protein YqfD [Defluviitaleaceae bacterium]|nr:sporulation protein YqfD [Defluviitaleaceae bacterium]
MLLALHKFFRGYVTMEVRGFAIPRFINLILHKNIYIWNLYEDEGQGRTFFNCSIKAFRLLHPAAKKSGVRLRIRRKQGLPFILHKNRRRKPWIIGAALFMALFMFLSSFVWLVEITGNDTIGSEDLRIVLQQQGVAPGLFRRRISPREVEGAVMAAFTNISYANVTIHGTRAVLSVVETIRPPQISVDRGIPADVIAAKDGIIHDMATEAGRPLVRPGDVVAAGDVLVSGELRVGTDYGEVHSYFVHAEARVTARRYVEYIFDVPLYFTSKNFTGNQMRNYGIIVFNTKIYLENAPSPFINYELSHSESRMSFGRNHPMPFAFFYDIFREFIPETEERTVDEALIMGQTIITSRLNRELGEGSFEVLNIEMAYEETDENVRVTAVITILEVISMQREIVPEIEAVPGE